MVLSYRDRVDVDFVQWIPLVAALGVGSVLGNWIGQSRARREVRSAALKALAATEMTRWATPLTETTGMDFGSAARDLETAALIARIPRRAVHHYLVFADAAKRISQDHYDDRDGDEELGAGMIPSDYASVVRGAAEVITRLTWQPWWYRVFYRWDLRALRRDAFAEAKEDRTTSHNLATIQKTRARLTGPLGELVDEWYPKTRTPPPLP